MKIKKFHKKLVLNKKTIAHLGNREQDVVKGGEPTRSCPSNCYCTQTEPLCVTCPTWATCPLTGKPCVQCE